MGPLTWRYFSINLLENVLEICHKLKKLADIIRKKIKRKLMS